MNCVDCIGRLQGLAAFKSRKCVDCTGRLQKFVTILAAYDTCYETAQATPYATMWITNIYVSFSSTTCFGCLSHVQGCRSCTTRGSSNILHSFITIKEIIVKHSDEFKTFFFLLALQPPQGVVFYSPLAGFSLLACEVS